MINNLEEQQVLDIFEELLYKYDKQGAGTVRDGHTRVSLFGKQCRFDLSKSFPLFTHRQHFMRGVFEEVMWYVRGETDNQILKDKGFHIWDLWEGQIDPERPTELGKIYGHMFRNFGEAKIEDLDAGVGIPLKEQVETELPVIAGFDQLSWLINEIKTNPSSSRLILSNWDPKISTQTPKEAVLPCCLTLLQFHVEDGKLHSLLHQRSSDCSIAGGWNVSQIALLTLLLAQQCDLAPGEFVWNTGNIHLYGNQIDDVREMIGRETHPFPQIKINKAKDIFSYQWSDIEILNYKHSGKMEHLKVSV